MSTAAFSRGFPDLQVGLLHGRLSSAEKQQAIEAFSRGETQLLVSTTVVEVGVDVPNATVMLIDHAERFGLAQLHQLRGRVGRERGSHCLLVNDSSSAVAKQRLEVLARSNDGFEIAEMDLRCAGLGKCWGRANRDCLIWPSRASVTMERCSMRPGKQLKRSLMAIQPWRSTPTWRSVWKPSAAASPHRHASTDEPSLASDPNRRQR